MSFLSPLAFDVWSLHVPPVLALAVVAALGYLIGCRARSQRVEREIQSRRELRRAINIAADLDKIARGVRRNLTRHQANLQRFKRRVEKLSQAEAQSTWRDLCQEAEQFLQPTLQLTNH